MRRLIYIILLLLIVTVLSGCAVVAPVVNLAGGVVRTATTLVKPAAQAALVAAPFLL